MHITEVGLNLFQFKFQSEFDMSKVLRGGHWSFDNQLLLLQRWQKGMMVGNIKWNTLLFGSRFRVHRLIWFLLK